MKLQKNKKPIIIIVIIVILIAAAVAGYTYWPYWILNKEERLLYDGYCPEIGRPLTDQEKCDIAVQEIISKIDSSILHRYFSENENGKIIYSERHVANYYYSNLEEFYDMNPNCYQFVEEIEVPDAPPFTIPLKEKINGRLNTVIKVTYIFAFDEMNDNKPINIAVSYGLSNCGKLWTTSDIIRLQHRGYWR